MSLKSTPARYGSVAITIHWASALAVVLAWIAGFVVANTMPAGPGTPILLVHITLGLIVFALTLLRLLWWFALDHRPAEVGGQPRWQRLLAGSVHAALYVLLLLLASSGIATLILSGAVPTLLAGGPIPDLSGLVPRIAHGIMSRVLLGLFVLHVGAALFHQFIRHDHLLARMGVGA